VATHSETLRFSGHCFSAKNYFALLNETVSIQGKISDGRIDLEFIDKDKNVIAELDGCSEKLVGERLLYGNLAK
jgi:hypothetical protein